MGDYEDPNSADGQLAAELPGAAPVSGTGTLSSGPRPQIEADFPSPHGRKERILWAVAGAVLVMIVWQVLSALLNPVFAPSPTATTRALGRLAWGGTLWLQLLITLMRLVVGLIAGSALGLVFGVLAGLNSRIRSLFEPIRWVGMTIPAVIIVVLTALWFGPSHFTVIAAVALIVIPIIYMNTVGGILTVDKRLVEIGKIHRFSRTRMLTRVYLPGIVSPVMAGLAMTTSVGLRAVVLMEVMLAPSGIGHLFRRAWTRLDTAEMFALVIVVLALMAVIEVVVLRPLRHRAMPRRKVGTAGDIRDVHLRGGHKGR